MIRRVQVARSLYHSTFTYWGTISTSAVQPGSSDRSSKPDWPLANTGHMRRIIRRRYACCLYDSQGLTESETDFYNTYLLAMGC